MNCVNCGSKMTSSGCLCRPSGNATDLLGKLERSNDAWINAQEMISELNEEIAGLKAERKESFEQCTAIIHDLKAENIMLEKRLEPIFNVWGRWKDFQRTSYPTVEQTHQALYDFGKAIEKSMTGYNPSS